MLKHVPVHDLSVGGKLFGEGDDLPESGCRGFATRKATHIVTSAYAYADEYTCGVLHLVVHNPDFVKDFATGVIFFAKSAIEVMSLVHLSLLEIRRCR